MRGGGGVHVDRLSKTQKGMTPLWCYSVPRPPCLLTHHSFARCTCCCAGNYEEKELLEELDNILKGEGWTDFDDGRTT